MKSDKYFFLGLVLVFIALIIAGMDQAKGDEPAWSYGGMISPVSNNYFASTGWRSVEDWEIEQCQRKLSSEIELDMNNQGSFSDVDMKYGTGVTLQAGKSDYYGDIYYELAWYVQPVDKNITFKLTVFNDETNEEFEVMKPTKLIQNQGRGYYYAWETTENYTHAKLDYEEGVLIAPIVEVERN